MMEKMQISGNMAPPCLVLDGLVGFLHPWLDERLEEMITIGKQWGGLPWCGHRGTREGCQGRCKRFCCILVRAGRAAGRQARPCRQQRWPPPLGECVAVDKHKYLLCCCSCSAPLWKHRWWGSLWRFLAQVWGEEERWLVSRHVLGTWRVRGRRSDI